MIKNNIFLLFCFFSAFEAFAGNKNTLALETLSEELFACGAIFLVISEQSKIMNEKSPCTTRNNHKEVHETHIKHYNKTISNLSMVINKTIQYGNNQSFEDIQIKMKEILPEVEKTLPKCNYDEIFKKDIYSNCISLVINPSSRMLELLEKYPPNNTFKRDAKKHAPLN